MYKESCCCDLEKTDQKHTQYMKRETRLHLPKMPAALMDTPLEVVHIILEAQL